MDSHPIGKVFFAFCKSIDTPVALGCWLRYKYSQKDLAEIRIHPSSYDNVEHFAKDYAVTSFLRKYEGLETGIDTEQAARLTFATSEARCLETNKLFSDPKLRGISPRDHLYLHKMTRKISSLLGPLDVSMVLAHCRWGNGATSTLRRAEASLDNKISEVPLSVTYKALPYIKAFIEADPHWFSAICGSDVGGPYSVLDNIFRITPGDKIDFVNKDATTKRTIGKTPTANSFLQQGPGRFIRKRLLRCGINLNDQTINQNWALLAGDLGLATIDLKSASDTTAKEMVFHLLPLDWALFLDALRSPFYNLDGEWTYANKFSAMGTAFTFELESLIFWAAASAVSEEMTQSGIVSVYGDDIIVQNEVAPELIRLLAVLGYDTNMQKTHTSGHFRESCGVHVWDNINITPTYQKEVLRVEDLGSSFLRCHNRLYRFAHRTCDSISSLARAGDIAALTCRRLAPVLVQDCEIPDVESGDDGFLVPTWELLSRSFDENHGILCRVLLTRPKLRHGYGRALLAHSLRKCHGRDLEPLDHLREPDYDAPDSRIEDRRRRFEYYFSERWITPRVALT
jgi:hypothetical protein